VIYPNIRVDRLVATVVIAAFLVATGIGLHHRSEPSVVGAPTASAPVIASHTPRFTRPSIGLDANHRPLTEARKDTRSPEQIAMAACERADGSWACPGVRRPLGATPLAQITPPSWTVPGWDIDTGNSSGCASDSNTGTSATCGAAGSDIGPLLTTAQLIQARWGTSDPELDQITTLTFLSNSTAPFKITGHGSAGLIYTGPLGSAQQVWTGTAAGFVGYNYVAGNLSSLTAWTGAAKGQLVYDSTQNAYAWVDHITSGTVYLTAQQKAVPVPPNYDLSSLGIPGIISAPWASTDTLIAYTPVQIGLSSTGYHQTSVTITAQSNLLPTTTIYHLGITEPRYAFVPHFTLSDASLVEESIFFPPSSGGGGYGQLFVERVTTNQFSGTENTPIGGVLITSCESYPIISGGSVFQAAACAVEFCRDVIIENGSSFAGAIASFGVGDNSVIGGMYLSPTTAFYVYGSGEIEGVLWGNGDMDILGSIDTSYPATKTMLSRWTIGLTSTTALAPQSVAGVTNFVGPMVTNLGNGTVPQLLGTFSLANGSSSVTASVSQTGSLVNGDLMNFSSQVGTIYTIATVSGTAIVLTASYTGTTAAAAVANTQPLDRTLAMTGGFGGVAIGTNNFQTNIQLLGYPAH
jgi:hypothetical protein